jgi:hypothetical protein
MNEEELFIRPLTNVLSGNDILNGHYVDVPVGNEPTPLCTKTEWYCDNSDCYVRETSVKFPFRCCPEKPQPLYCPACRRQMRFLHYVEQHLLVPVGLEDVLERRRCAEAGEEWAQQATEEQLREVASITEGLLPMTGTARLGQLGIPEELYEGAPAAFVGAAKRVWATMREADEG